MHRTPLLICWTLLAASSAGAVNVWTHQNDNARTGANTSETILTTTNVNKTTFGKLFYYPVDGQVFAEPLYVSGLAIAGGTHNVVYVATMHNSVYALDADSATTASTPLWKVGLGPSVPMPDSKIGVNLPEGGGFCGTASYNDIKIEVGILSTPVIDLATSTLYVVAKTKDAAGSYFDHLHALDLVTGAEKMGGPIPISASVTGTGKVPVKTFLAYRGNQRSGLALGNGKVYVTYASYCDAMPYYGWVFGYDAANLTAAPVLFNSAMDGDHNGIWMVGGSPSIDAAGNVFVITGNGPFNTNVGGANYGDSFVKLTPNLAVVDFFTPFNAQSLAGDGDLNLGSALLVPGTNVVMGAGKEAKVYLLDQNNMGHFHANDDSQILQSFSIGSGWPHGGFVYWQSPSGPQVYVATDKVKAFKLSGNTLTTTAASTATWGGGLLSLSANGSTAGTGILWSLNGSTLHAVNAEDLTKELWNTGQNSARDAIGGSTKFTVPMIANGKVYVPSMGNVVPVYGILGSGPTPTPGPTAATPTATASPTPLAPSVIAITSDHVFVPSTMSLLVGMTATWLNQDDLTHTATSTTGLWDSGQILTGATYSRTFTTVGSFPYYCTLHPNMTGQINVTNAPTRLLAINSGGPGASPFVADTAFSGGSTISHANTIDVGSVIAPAPAAVYQTARTGNFTYTLSGFAAGSNHLVRLHFCETYFTAAGKRTFNVSLNGTQVLSSYDVFAKAGAQNKAVVETWSASANASGQYVVQLATVVNSSLLSGIEVSDAPASSIPTPTVTPTPTSTPTPTATSRTAPTATATSTSTSTPTPTATTATSGIQINSGGSAASPYVADAYFAGGTTINHANTIDVTGVASPAPVAVYQTGRVNNFTYTIPGFAAGSSHTVRLHFCETYFSAAGSRVFGVTLNGTQVLTSFDIYAAAGAKNKAVVRSFTSAANTSGQYVIQFTSVTNQSLVSGIEVQ